MLRKTCILFYVRLKMSLINIICPNQLPEMKMRNCSNYKLKLAKNSHFKTSAKSMCGLQIKLHICRVLFFTDLQIMASFPYSFFPYSTCPNSTFWCQFHQYFTSSICLQKCFAQLYCAYNLGLYFFFERKSVQKQLEKCWWSWLLDEFFFFSEQFLFRDLRMDEHE